jgi:hypothetical protein
MFVGSHGCCANDDMRFHTIQYTVRPSVLEEVWVKNLSAQSIKPEEKYLRKTGPERNLKFYLLSYWSHIPQSEHAISQNQFAV